MSQNNNQIFCIDLLENKGQIISTGISRKLGAFIAASVFTLSGCDISPEDKLAHSKQSGEITPEVVPEGLIDCKFYKVFSFKKTLEILSVVRCPNATTSTTMHEKNPKTIVVIDGEENEKKSKK